MYKTKGEWNSENEHEMSKSQYMRTAQLFNKVHIYNSIQVDGYPITSNNSNSNVKNETTNGQWKITEHPIEVKKKINLHAILPLFPHSPYSLECCLSLF
jgi:hypothetical protein